MMAKRISVWVAALIVLLLLAVPIYSNLAAEPFALTFFSRVLIFALAAISLNLILGYGGMVSFGHALYLGLGAYAVGLLAQNGITNGWVQLAATVVVCALVGAITGAISLRTSGIAFIMITLAFAQMFFYLFVSLKQYGGDDGLSIPARSDFGLFTLASPITLYYVALALVLAVLFFTKRLIDARFGMVLQGCRINERRMKAMGFPSLRYKLSAYVLSSVLCGVAGLLYANLTGFASPAYMAWTLSGEIIVIVVLGGMGTVFGPLVGSLVLLLSEEVLKAFTEHWMMILGPLIVLVVLTARRGVYGYLLDWDAWRERRKLAADVKRSAEVLK
ncbi:MAG: branched-chain amino acid ABC transporter permease [Pseudomonadota bacterium]